MPPTLTKRGRSDVWQTGAGTVCGAAAGVCGIVVPVVSSGRESGLCGPGAGTEHGASCTACPAGQFLRLRRPSAHRAGRALVGPVYSGAGKLCPAVCLHHAGWAGAAVPEPQPHSTVSAGADAGPFFAEGALLPECPALLYSAALPTSDRFSEQRRQRGSRVGKGVGCCPDRHRRTGYTGVQRYGTGASAGRGRAGSAARRQRCAGSAADHLPSGAARGRSGCGRDDAERLHYDSGRAECCCACQCERAGIRSAGSGSQPGCA